MLPGSMMLHKIFEEQEAVFLMSVVKSVGYLPEPSQQTNYDTLQ
jgi:hypothetical protein